ncbi:molybdenum cofactor guanylyltransferase [Hyphomonas sp.]|uniref:molybdenum cofactor guanylyltransferase n=1 Tax=Hyphomonas sp. TaxID=87 RepID=UPI0035288837
MWTASRRERGFLMDRVGVVILAGGFGTRMGGGKSERLFRGRRLIDPVIDLVNAWHVPAVMCVREPAQVKQEPFGWIFDRPDIDGPLAGLLAAFEWARGESLDRFLTLPCDTPFLPADALEKLYGASEARMRPAVAVSNGRRHPVCAVWPAESFGRVETYAEAGRRSLVGALEACGAVDVTWPEGDPDVFVNMNTPEDLVRFES